MYTVDVVMGPVVTIGAWPELLGAIVDVIGQTVVKLETVMTVV